MSHQFFKIIVRSFPTHEVRVMGQKLEVSCQFSTAEAVGIILLQSTWNGSVMPATVEEV